MITDFIFGVIYALGGDIFRGGIAARGRPERVPSLPKPPACLRKRHARTSKPARVASSQARPVVHKWL